jgi:hypothetical protein
VDVRETVDDPLSDYLDCERYTRIRLHDISSVQRDVSRFDLLQTSRVTSRSVPSIDERRLGFTMTLRLKLREMEQPRKR